MRSVSESFTVPRGVEGKYLTFLGDERFTEMAWISPFATGKTDCLVTSIIRTGFEYPGCIMVLARDELVNLKRTTLVDLLSKGGHLMAHHNKTDSVISWPEVRGSDGRMAQSRLFCFGLMTGDYVQKLKSLQPFRIFIDEGDKVLEEMFDMCVLRVRQKVFHHESGKLGRNQVKIVANDEGNNWLWRRFVGKPHPGRSMTPEWVKRNIGIREEFYDPSAAEVDLFVDDLVEHAGKRYLVRSFEGGRAVLSGPGLRVDARDVRVVMQRLCVYAFTHENKSLNTQNLRNSRFVSSALRDKYILGQVDTQTGLLFPEFDLNTHVIPEGPIPYSWRVVVGIDHGYDHPTAAVMMVLAPGGEVIVFDEYVMRNQSPSENADGILERLGGYEKIRFFADSQMWNVDPRNPGTVAEDYMRAGVKPLARANKNRELSIGRIKDYLIPRAASVHLPDPRPRLMVMDRCRETIKALQYLQWDDFRAKRNDDVLDALRYGVMGVYNASARDDVSVPQLEPRPFATWRD